MPSKVSIEINFKKRRKIVAKKNKTKENYQYSFFRFRAVTFYFLKILDLVYLNFIYFKIFKAYFGPNRSPAPPKLKAGGTLKLVKL